MLARSCPDGQQATGFIGLNAFVKHPKIKAKKARNHRAKFQAAAAINTLMRSPAAPLRKLHDNLKSLFRWPMTGSMAARLASGAYPQGTSAFLVALVAAVPFQRRGRTHRA